MLSKKRQIVNMNETPVENLQSQNRDLLSPRHRGDFLRAVADFETELFRVEAGFLPGLKRWNLKRELGELIFRDARKVQELRIRCRELDGSASAIHRADAVRGYDLIQKLCHAPDAENAFFALFSIIKPALRDIVQVSVREDLRVFDAPSVPILEDNILELNKQITWAAKQPESQSGDSSPWLKEIETLSSQLADALSSKRDRALPPNPEARKIGSLPLLCSSIPEGITECHSGTPGSKEGEYPERALYHAHNFLMEIQAAESCASLLFEAPDMPWEFYFDLSRHMWDEMRHCEFGELKLSALGKDFREMGISNTAYVMRQTIDPLDRYAALTTQEADAFPGKHAGLKDAIKHADELSARAWSYDIADETQHVRYGHKWIPVMIEQTNDPRSFEQVKQDAENWRRNVLAAVYSPTARTFAKDPAPLAG